DVIRSRQGLRQRLDGADRLLRPTGRRPDRAPRESRHRHYPGAGAGDVFPLPCEPIPIAPRRRLAGAGVHRGAGRFCCAQCAFEILGRRRPRRVQELGSGHRSAQPAGRAPGRRRAHHAARIAAPTRYDGDSRKPPRCAGPPAHAVAAGQNRRRNDSLGGRNNLRPESYYGPNAGLTEILIPAGYVTTVYDPVFALSPDATRYVSVPSDTPTTLPPPGLPFSLVFRAEPGKEGVVLRIAAAYEAGFKRRTPPPAFGPLHHPAQR